MTSNIRAILVCLLAYVCFDLMAVHVRILSVRYSPQELSVYRNVVGILPTIALLAYNRELSFNLRAYKINSNLDFSNPVIIDSRSGNIDDDPEGVTIYKTSTNDGYILLSSQGDNSFNVYNRTEPYNYLGSFKIGHSGKIDNVNDTDGIDVVSNRLNSKYPKGLLVVQDGTNDGKKIVKRQNFKYVSFEEVIKALEL